MELLDCLRLEVEAPLPGNQIPAAAAAFDTLTGWSVDSGHLSAEAAAWGPVAIIHTHGAVPTDVVVSNTLSYPRQPIVPGVDYTAAISIMKITDTSQNTSARLSLVFTPEDPLDKSYATSETWALGAVALGFPDITFSWLAENIPDGTAYVALELEILDGDFAATVDPVRVDNARLLPAVFEDPDIPALVDIIGPTVSITVNRPAALEPGTLTAIVKDTSLAPGVSEALTGGKVCRLMAYDALDASWEPIFTGTITRALVAYDYTAKPGREATITITALDATPILARAVRPQGVAQLDELASVVAGLGIAWDLDGNTGPVSPDFYVATTPNATALDQIGLTRDGCQAYAWLDRGGVLRAYDTATDPYYYPDISPGSPVLLDESDYSALEVTNDSADVVNTVAVVIRTGTTDVPFGPFTDVGSRQRWGEAPVTVTVNGSSPYAPSDLANAFLDAQAQPATRAKSVAIPIRTPDQIRDSRALLDYYAVVEVHNDSHGLAQVTRVAGLSHTIRAVRGRGVSWLMGLTFTGLNSAAPARPRK